MGVAMDTYSINPASIIDEAVDLSMRLAGSDFPISIFPTKIQRIISEVHECHNYPTDYIAAAILTAIAVDVYKRQLLYWRLFSLRMRFHLKNLMKPLLTMFPKDSSGIYP